MARRYETDELLRLSASPLAVKPDSLPPAEEWMGPIPDPSTLKKNTHARENSNQETSNRRPSVFETRHTSRGSNSEDIVLGPPRTSFASASARILGKSFDLNDKSATNDGDDNKNERYNFRDKFFKDRDFGDKDPDRRETRLGGRPGRRGGRDDRDDWGGGRQRRTFGSDELERKPRRNGDSDRWGGGREDHRDQDHNNDRGPRDKDGRYPPRRDGQGRGRHEQSWFRDDGAHESADIEDDKRTMRNREWRQNRGTHGHDREWNRGAKFEQDPEWMDSTDREDTKQAHTQEDFQRWKERMKAGSGQAPPVEKKEPAVESGNGDFWQQPETKRADGELFSNLDTPLDNSGFDKFFGLWGESKTEKDGTKNAADAEVKKETAPAKVQKASRFAGIFSPPAEPVNQQPEPPVMPQPPPQPQPQLQPERPASGDADQEGFQRILQMLGGNKSRNTTPQADSSMQPRPPPPAQVEQAMPPVFPSPPRETGNRHEYMSLQDNSPRNRGPSNMESIPAPRPQKESSVHNRDSDFLLQLMQQAKISPSANSHQSGSHPSTAGHTPGVLNVPDLLSRPQGVQKQKTPTFLDDPAIANMQRPESNELRDQSRRRGNNAPPMGYFDDVSVSSAQNNQIAAEANKIRLQGPGQSSVGLQRPPGFEQMPPPPGWPNHQVPPPQQAGPNPVAPPPGIPNPPRNMNPGFPPGPMPMHGGMPPPQNERPILTRNVPSGGNGTPGGSSAGFGPPPGMGAPPGYMNMQGPPPAFPPMGNAPDAMARMPYGNQPYFGGGGGGPPPPQPPQQRHPLDMFGNSGNDGNVGGRLGAGMMGGPYR